MNHLEEIHTSKGDDIYTVLQPTIASFVPVLLAHAPAILSIPRTTHAYGTHPRQTLDIYLPPTPTPNDPYLVFFYGGGFITGDRIVPGVPQSLIYHNLGAFFANKGIKTIIADYRRASSEMFGGEGAVYPQGGEDLEQVLAFVEGLERGTKKEVYVLGNSVGGVHLTTFLLAPQFLERRKALVEGTGEIVFKGWIGLGVPFHFVEFGESSATVTYYGSEENAKAHQPSGLLKAIGEEGKSREELGIPSRALTLVSEWDPAEIIVSPIKDFVALWKKTLGEELELVTISGHNHISPPLALSTGEGEKWGDDVAKWIKKK